VIFADPLFRELSSGGGAQFVSLPHVAVSSKLCWDGYVNMIDGNIHDYLASEGF
jgi:hypothetical protein